MKTGIVLYSQTGNTELVANKLKVALMQAGHAAQIEKLTPVQADPKNPASFRYDAVPDLSGYDALVLAAPVQGFQLCAAMKAYLPKLTDLGGKKVACFTTKQFKSAWTGANNALKAMAKGAQDKGGKVCFTGFVSWKSPSKEMDMVELVQNIEKAFR